MRKISLLLSALLLCGLLAFSQQRSVTGRVTDDKGDPVPFATVQVKNSKTATVADANGTYSIKATNENVLVFSAQGVTSKEVTVGSSNSVNVVLAKSTTSSLTEVVVTGAYNTKKTSRSTSYSAQVVGGEQLNVIRQTNLNNALAGKVAGIQIRSQSSALLGNQGAVRLRGTSGLGGDQDIIYVVDGTILPNAGDINMDDIEDVTVLQGPAAAAQFGSQGANGAIVMSTKKAKRNASGLGIDLNLGAQAEKVYILPNYQNSYAGGNSADLIKYTWQEGQPEEWKALDGKYYHNYSDDASWGPRMVGQEYIPWYAWYGGTQYSYKTAKLTPQPNNAREFWNTGLTLNNSISLSKTTENASMRFSYGNIYIKGILPSSSRKTNTLNFNSTVDFSKRLTLSSSINYINQNTKGEFDDAYANQSSGSFNSWFHRDLDMGIVRELKDLRTPSGIYASWNHNDPTVYGGPDDELAFLGGNYWYNFYSYFENIRNVNSNDRLYGDISLTYKITPDLRIKGTYRKQQNTTWNEGVITSALQNSATQTGIKAFYGSANTYSNRRNIELMAAYSKKVGDFSINGNVGMDLFKWNYKDNGASTVNGLNVPDLYAISNSKDQASYYNSRTVERYNAVYAIANLGYKNFVFADLTLRKDWYSTLPPDNNGILSKSFGMSFVFSDLVKIPALSFGKLRASWGEVPTAIGTSSTTFGAYRYPGFAYAPGALWGSYFPMTTPNTLVDSAIHGSVKMQKEIGLELKFLKGRLGANVTYWDGTENDIPFSVTLNGASGYTSKLTNTGKITKKGLDLTLTGRPVWSKLLKWEINATYAYLLDNKVVKIAPNVTSTSSVSTIWSLSTPYVLHTEGMKWGQLYGSGIKMLNGQPILNDDGSYQKEFKYFGSVLPKYTGGVQNSFEIGNFLVNVNIDYQSGGKFFSLSDMWGSYSGLTARTGTYNDKGNPVRDDVANGGGVHVFGVDTDGKPKDMYVGAQQYYQGLYGNSTFDEFVYDLTFVKLREISVGYQIPVKNTKLGSYISRATVSLVAKNPVLIYAKTKDLDPSEVSYISGEQSQLPGTRGLGINLKVSF